jgi:hypothetical protein
VEGTKTHDGPPNAQYVKVIRHAETLESPFAEEGALEEGGLGVFPGCVLALGIVTLHEARLRVSLCA